MVDCTHYYGNFYSETPYKGHPHIKDTSLQWTLVLSHFDTLLCRMTPQQRTPLLKGHVYWSHGVRYREVPLTVLPIGSLTCI